MLVQSMWKDRLSFSCLDGKSSEVIIKYIETLKAMGCGLLRFAVPSIEDAEIIGELASRVSMPFCADIHFDYKIALRCLDFPIAKLRINPGNIGKQERVEKIISKAAAGNISIRIGVNSGSLPQKQKDKLKEKPHSEIDRAEALVNAALDQLEIFKQLGYTNAIVSMKASGITDTILANRLFRQRSDVPLHIGVTEAGPLISGIIRSCAALVPLLADGIGDTIRVSLSDTIENEIIAGKAICNAAAELARLAGNTGMTARLKQGGIKLISCPRCGRYGFDTIAFTERWKTRFEMLKNDCTIAVMGCEVNGPEEAKNADLGITGSGNSVIIFKQGRIIKRFEAKNNNEIDLIFEKELDTLC